MGRHDLWGVNCHKCGEGDRVSVLWNPAHSVVGVRGAECLSPACVGALFSAAGDLLAGDLCIGD